MRELFQEIMMTNAREVVFVHVLSAVFWVGGMIVMRFIVQPSLKNIQDDNIRIARALDIMKSFFTVVQVAIFLLVLTGVVMIMGLDLKNGSLDFYQLVIYKEAIWSVMLVVFIFLSFKRSRAQRHFVSGDIATAKKNIAQIETAVYVNILLGLAAIYLGVMVRGY